MSDTTVNREDLTRNIDEGLELAYQRGILNGLRLARERAFATDSVCRLVSQIDELIEQYETATEDDHVAHSE